MTAFNLNASEAVSLTVRLCCIGRAIGLAELAIARRERRAGGMLNWEVAGLVADPALDEKPSSFPGFARLRSFVWRRFVGVPPWLFTCFLWIDAAAVLGLFLWPGSAALRATAAIFLLIQMKRHYFSVDGSDEMTLLCLAATCLGGIGDSSRYVAFFLAAELALAYTTAGAYKAASPFWQKGKALLSITRTRAFGHPQVSKLLNRHPLLSRYSELALVLWESGFLIALIAPRPVLWMMLAAGLVFHLSCAWVMGLNTFLWAFAAGYPCVIFANREIHSVVTAPVDGYLTAALALAVILAVVFAGRHVARDTKEAVVAAKEPPGPAATARSAHFLHRRGPKAHARIAFFLRRGPHGLSENEDSSPGKASIRSDARLSLSR
jgi:hypothetical protein